MKSRFKTKILPLSAIVILIQFSTIISAANVTDSLVINNSDYLKHTPSPFYLEAVNNDNLKIAENSSESITPGYQINYHKILGWSTLGMMSVTIASGFIIPRKGHCALAGITTGLAVATCADGIFEYRGLISLADGDWRYNTHAILGILATAGFITTLALADGGAHVATGIASGTAFTIALGVIYF